jgi:hypothetical protein
MNIVQRIINRLPKRKTALERALEPYSAKK